jgi:hypothetical protein
MIELFEPPRETPKKTGDAPPPERISSNAIVFLFFYFAIGAGVFFAVRRLIPSDGTPGYAIVLVVLYGSWWLFRKFLRRN